MIQGCMLILSIIFIVTNMVVDLLYGLLDLRALRGDSHEFATAVFR